VTPAVKNGKQRLAEFLAESRTWADRELARRLPPPSAAPARLHEAMRYAVFGEGKRLRPAVVRMLCLQFGGQDPDAAPPAVAIECVHTYSLVHDDLPCMDDDDLRRGRPTVHKVFGEALAVLAGDALLTQAFSVLACCGPLAGLALGRCFQAVDDILDVTGDAQTLGKTPGKDQAAGKATLVSALGLEGARVRARALGQAAREAAAKLGCGPGDLPYDLVEELLLRRS
jgi:geranylgeranyl pyrophosphate synthase